MTVVLSLAVVAACAPEHAPQQAQKPTSYRAPKDYPFHWPEDSPLLPVAEDDPAHRTVAREMERIKERYARFEAVDAAFSPPREIEGKALQQLFPNHRFFLLAWDEKEAQPLPAGVPRPIGLALCLNEPLAVDREGQVARLLGPIPHFAPFGDFLAANGVKITAKEDGRLVWGAVCELYRLPRDGRIEKLSDRRWRLGVVTFRPRDGDRPQDGDPEKAYFGVQLNPDLSVKSARFEREQPGGSAVGSWLLPGLLRERRSERDRKGIRGVLRRSRWPK